ncbi:MAG: hypothetical protein HYR88_00015 [Verrucomicrobia bacterium]|nr:hypothetical protein [Verrucomicrobiota bacterium]MBI3867480.1 hypothetical protein [Verrucomicrobiota bacterium]
METSTSISVLKGLVVLLALIGVMIGFMVCTVKRSKDPGAIQVKWIITIIIVSGLFTFVRGIELFSYAGAFTVPFACMAVGVAMAILWGPHIAAFLASPVTNAISGGDEQIKARPIYSMAQARRKMGKYAEAVELVQAQLERFPADYEGEMLLAAIHVEDLNDINRGEVTVKRICNRPATPPAQVAGALSTLADWQQRYAQNNEMARQALEEISRLLPDSEYDRAARQRVAHLASDQSLLDQHDRPRVVMKEGVKRIGLVKNAPQIAPATPTPADEAMALVERLKKHPDDNEAGERLAHVYAMDFHRADMGIGELERLIARPHQLPKDIARWINAIADIQIKELGNVEAASASLQRIIDLFPKSASADLARSRMHTLKREHRGQEKTAALHLGEYEQRLGLRTGGGDPQRREDDAGRA